MNLIELSKYLQDEDLAEQYLIEKRILKNFTNCPYCNSEKIGHIRRGKIKCYSCKKEWNKRKGSFLEFRRIKYSKFIAFIKLYSEDYNFNQIASELNIDIKSTTLLHLDLRRSIVNDFINTLNLSASKIILFQESNHIVLKYLRKEETINQAIEHYQLCIKRSYGIGKTYSFKLKTIKSKNIDSENNDLDRFINYAIQKLRDFNSSRIENALLYLAELCIKYNRQEEEFYEIIIQNINFNRVAVITFRE